MNELKGQRTGPEAFTTSLMCYECGSTFGFNTEHRSKTQIQNTDTKINK